MNEAFLTSYYTSGTWNISSLISFNTDGSWNISEPVSLTFGIACVRLHFVHEENIWLSCSNKLFQLEIDSLETQVC